MRTIELIPLKDLTLVEYNPRTASRSAIERLKKSLSSERGKELFEKRPCLVNKREGKLVVYAGNMRYRAAGITISVLLMK